MTWMDALGSDLVELTKYGKEKESRAEVEVGKFLCSLGGVRALLSSRFHVRSTSVPTT